MPQYPPEGSGDDGERKVRDRQPAGADRKVRDRQPAGADPKVRDRQPAGDKSKVRNRQPAGGERAVRGAARQSAPGGECPATADDRMNALAARQCGVVARGQLLAMGMGAERIKHRVRTRRLVTIHLGVYRVGPLAGDGWREMAALLACGAEAAISHRSAGGLWRVLTELPADAPVDVIIPAESRRHRPGIATHRRPKLQGDEVTAIGPLRVTTAARTVMDLGCVLPARQLEQALARAERLELATRADVAALLERHAEQRGARSLRPLLDAAQPSALTRSEAEERLLSLLREAHLPPAETNTQFRGMEVDFLWRAERLVVEVDGFAFHSSPSRFEQDRRRDARLAAAGLRVVRVTWRQLTREPLATIALLAQTLARAGP